MSSGSSHPASPTAARPGSSGTSHRPRPRPDVVPSSSLTFTEPVAPPRPLRRERNSRDTVEAAQSIQHSPSMAHRDQRPPRAVPPSSAAAHAAPQANRQSSQLQGPGISFQQYERGDRAGPLPFESRQNRYSGNFNPQGDLDEAMGARVGRKRSLVRPDRERIDPGHRQYHYRNHAAQLEEQNARFAVLPSTTGNVPHAAPGLRRGKSLLGREQDVPESGLTLFKRGATLRRRLSSAQSVPTQATQPAPSEERKKGFWDHIGPGPKDGWMIYCWLLTCWIPPFLLKICGIKTPEQQRAWREKMGLLSIIAVLMLGVGFLTFGFTETVCGNPPAKFQTNEVSTDSVVIHGKAYNLAEWNHPKTSTVFNGTSNPLRDSAFQVAGRDISFMFQNVHGSCAGILTAASSSAITKTGDNPNWFFPCNSFSIKEKSQVDKGGYDKATNCHASNAARENLAGVSPSGVVAYSWEDIAQEGRNLAVYESAVLDFDLLSWLDSSQISFPSFFGELSKANGTFNGKDITMYVQRTDQRQLFDCLQENIQVGFIDTKTIGCVASDVVLYISLVFIIGVVAIRFFMAVLFGWFYSWRLGNFRGESFKARMQRAAEIEEWSDNIYRPAPSRYRPNVVQKGNKKGVFFPNTSRFSRGDGLKSGSRPLTTYGDQMKGRPPTMFDGSKSRPSTTYSSLEPGNRKSTAPSLFGGKSLAPPESFGNSRSSTSLPSDEQQSNCPFPLHNVVPQPPPDWMPFNFPLAHTICLVTAYSESEQGLRTTLDSLATTDYPNSHKLLMVIADGKVKGAGNEKYTHEIVLDMMEDFVISPQAVEPHSYVAIADGHKRHNMAKVYAGFYKYDSKTVETSKQQRVPIVLVAKVGNPNEQGDAKAGNRGKRDSQIVLMSFLQKIMFDERMTTMEYEFFNSVWRVTGVCPDKYELVLCVDADTKVFPDSLTRMAACMVNDPEIMGLCGETKIANKSDSWVTMIQVFEYYISHHLTKAFESMFGGVTCLPGCFSMYRIKAPKLETGYWVPVLANPDVVEHYSENIVDTLHKKNLLLLGEDRYLTTLMLKTFPKRKMVFCPQAVCKTIVPDQFGILLSQRRRWINSTVHNLAELLLVRDLCGTFCFSMQFVVFMELSGTLVLPAAITFTFYLIIKSAMEGARTTLIPLILLGIILGLPGLLIVVTSRKLEYLGWMVIYLFSLPVWNFVLPAYSFWHFDDFSWGQTRMVSGEAKTDNHGDKDGEFDSSHIVMKRWAEFERDRRWKSGTQSRDSTFHDSHRGPTSIKGNRQSLVSVPDGFDYRGPQFMGASYHSESPDGSPRGYSRSRGDSAPLLQLPAPLAVTTSHGSQGSHGAPPSIASTTTDAPYVRVADSGISPYSPDLRDDERESMLPQSDNASLMSGRTHATMMGPGAVIRNAPGQTAYPVEMQNPYRNSQPQVASYEQVPHTASFGFAPGPEEFSPASPQLSAPQRRQSRGVSLVDNGPVSNSDQPVRRVARQSKRASTGQSPGQSPGPRYNQWSSSQPPSAPQSPHMGPQQQVYSPTTQQQYLPPGAAPPQNYLPPGAAPPQHRYGQ